MNVSKRKASEPGSTAADSTAGLPEDPSPPKRLKASNGTAAEQVGETFAAMASQRAVKLWWWLRDLCKHVLSFNCNVVSSKRMGMSRACSEKDYHWPC